MYYNRSILSCGHAAWWGRPSAGAPSGPGLDASCTPPSTLKTKGKGQSVYLNPVAAMLSSHREERTRPRPTHESKTQYPLYSTSHGEQSQPRELSPARRCL